MHGAIETEEVNGLTISYFQDEDAQDPRKEWDHLGTMVCAHGRYNLGDRGLESDEYQALRRGGFPLLRRYMRRFCDVVCLLPLSLLDHSGLHMYVGADSHWSDPGGWDSGIVGFIYATSKAADETPDVEAYLRGEVEEYDQYLRGDVCGYVIEDADGDDVDSCWGFYGFDTCQSEARGIAAGIEPETAFVKAGLVEG